MCSLYAAMTGSLMHLNMCPLLLMTSIRFVFCMGCDLCMSVVHSCNVILKVVMTGY